jgi:hypothetical protein
LLAASAEKAVLRIIAAESANFVTLDMVLSLVCAPQALRRHTDMIQQRAAVFPVAKIGASLSDNFLING